MSERFRECDTCAAKPGSPPLCGGCIHNRQLIEKLLCKAHPAEAATSSKAASPSRSESRENGEATGYTDDPIVQVHNMLKFVDPAQEVIPSHMKMRHIRALVAAISVHPQDEPVRVQQQGANGKIKSVKRWPFVETPGEFTARFARALGYDSAPEENSPGLAAMRTVLIEQPPTLSKEYVALALSRAPQPDSGEATNTPTPLATVTDEMVLVPRKMTVEMKSAFNHSWPKIQEGWDAALTAALSVKGK